MKLVDQTRIPPPYLHLRGPQPSPPPPYDAPRSVQDRYDEACNAVRKRLEAGDPTVLDDRALFPASPEVPAVAEAPPEWAGEHGLVVTSMPDPRGPWGGAHRVLVKVLEVAAAKGRVRRHAWCVLDRASGALLAWSRGIDARWMGDSGRVLIVEWTGKEEPNGFWLVQTGSPERRTRLEQPEGDARCAQDLAPTESPGRWIVWLADGHGASTFELVHVDEAGARRIYCEEWNPWQTHPGDGRAPTVSPDGRWLGYLSVDDDGSPLIVVCDLDARLAAAYRYPPSLEPFVHDEDLRIHVDDAGSVRASTAELPLRVEVPLENALGAPRPWRA